MGNSGSTLLRAVALMIIVFVVVVSNGAAQSASPVESSLRSLRSSDMNTRCDAFYALIRPFQDNPPSPPDRAVWRLLRAYPNRAEVIKAALIAALERQGVYRDELEKSGEGLSETFTECWANLIQAVGSLRDARAAKGLLAAQDTGGMAAGFLADLCPGSIDATIARFREPERYWQGYQLDSRAAALGALSRCFTRISAMRSAPDASAKARSVLLAALDDPDAAVRITAVQGLYAFRKDPEVRARLEDVAVRDAYVLPMGTYSNPKNEIHYSVRESTRDVLAPVDESHLYYIMRMPENGECRVQQAVEQPVGEQFIGPFKASSAAGIEMCHHYEGGEKGPALCARVYPPQACSQ